MRLVLIQLSIQTYLSNCTGMTAQNITENNQTADQLALHYLIKEPKTNTTKNKAIILLHVVGSNEQDLFSLAEHLPDDYFIISPRGQFTLSAGRYAWYHVDFSTGKPVFNAQQELSSRKIIFDFINQVKLKYQLDEVYIGGFSQGAIMSYTIGLLDPQEIQGVIALGGRMLEEIKPIVTGNKDLKKLKVFIAHGVQDNTLPVGYARAAKSYLEDLPVQLSYHEYEMGHQISPAVLADLNKWLAI